MELFLGDNARKYYDRGIVEKEVKKKRKTDIFDLLRKAWLFTGGIFSRTALRMEVKFLKNVSFTAWKINLYATINK